MFTNRTAAKDGLNCWCKPCHTKYRREYMRKYRVEVLGQTPHEIRKVTDYQLYRKHYHLLGLYGITLQEFNDLLYFQENKCLMCTTKLTDPVVDHCHRTGEVRGILCRRCNLALGQFNDDKKLIKNALDYLG